MPSRKTETRCAGSSVWPALLGQLRRRDGLLEKRDRAVAISEGRVALARVRDDLVVAEADPRLLPTVEGLREQAGPSLLRHPHKGGARWLLGVLSPIPPSTNWSDRIHASTARSCARTSAALTRCVARESARVAAIASNEAHTRSAGRTCIQTDPVPTEAIVGDDDDAEQAGADAATALNRFMAGYGRSVEET